LSCGISIATSRLLQLLYGLYTLDVTFVDLIPNECRIQPSFLLTVIYVSRCVISLVFGTVAPALKLKFYFVIHYTVLDVS